MAKKAKTASWRTLTRQADKERSPRKASALRKKAWAARRADRALKQAAAKKKVKKAAPAARRIPAAAARAVKAWATRRANVIKMAAEGGLAALAASAPQGSQNGINQSYGDWANERGMPGQGELVGGAFSQMADQIAKLARKKGGTDAIQSELASLASSSKYEGSAENEKAATKRLVEVQQIMADRIVCGFLAEIEHTMNFHRGLPPGMVHTIDSFTITKIVDALNKAGYRSTGKT